MVIVKILGGFASQLRHYGVGYLLAKSKNTDLYLDLSDYVEGYFRPFMLHFVSVPDCFILRDKSLLNRVIFVKSGEQLIDLFKKEPFPDVYLGGETADYSTFFEQYPEQYPGMDFELFGNLRFNYKSPFLESFKNTIANYPGIGVHVRMGDFDELGVADSIDKYKAAIGWILKDNPSYKVYFFSNDINSTIARFGNDSRYKFIDYQNGYLGDVEEFFALSMCQEKIIASRSGYSRYASFLGMRQYGSNKAVCLENVDNLSDEFIFMNENRFEEGMKFYSQLCPCNSDNMEFIGREFEPEIRYDTVCWNSVIHDKKAEADFWCNFYDYHTPLKNRSSYVIYSIKKYNRWYFKGLYLKALVYSRVGRNVLYICQKGNDSFGMNINKIIPAKDMDGKDLGFDIYISENKPILNDIYSKWEKKSENVKYIRDSLKDFLFSLIKKISNHHFKDDCLYLPSQLSDFGNYYYYINEMIEKSISKD